MWGKFRILVFQNFPDLLGLGYLFEFLLSACTDFYFFHEAARNINTQSSPQSEVCLQKTKALFFFFLNHLSGPPLISFGTPYHSFYR